MKKFVAIMQIDCIFATVNARVAQLVELQPSKLTVAGSSPVSRSKKKPNFCLAFFITLIYVQIQVAIQLEFLKAQQ